MRYVVNSCSNRAKVIILAIVTRKRTVSSPAAPGSVSHHRCECPSGDRRYFGPRLSGRLDIQHNAVNTSAARPFSDQTVPSTYYQWRPEWSSLPWRVLDIGWRAARQMKKVSVGLKSKTFHFDDDFIAAQSRQNPHRPPARSPSSTSSTFYFNFFDNLADTNSWAFLLLFLFFFFSFFLVIFFALCFAVAAHHANRQSPELANVIAHAPPIAH